MYNRETVAAVLRVDTIYAESTKYLRLRVFFILRGVRKNYHEHMLVLSLSVPFPLFGFEYQSIYFSMYQILPDALWTWGRLSL
jgi:hypothetical protein